MTLVVVSSEADFADVIGTRGFGGQGASKVGAILQGGRLAYRTAKFAYKRYFGYATRTRSRAIGTSTGASIGLGAGIVAIPKSGFEPTPYQNRQARDSMDSAANRFRSRYRYKTCYRRPKRRQRYC